MTEPTNPWKTVKSRVIHQSRWLTLYEDDVITPTGQPGTYTYTQGAPFVLVVAYDGQHFIFVRQFRYPLKRVMIEFPGGSIDENETPLGAAKREFRDETGFTANKWDELGTIHNPNLATVFLAQDLAQTGKNEMAVDGISDLVRMGWADIDHAIQADEFTDSKTLAALMLFSRHINKA